MDTLGDMVVPEFVPGHIYQLGDLRVQSQVFYDGETWLVIAHSRDERRGINQTEIANGAYYANRQTLFSDTEVILI